MQTVGPYRLLQALGTCQVGGVWSATDALNNQVTVAVLSASAGRDPGWRSAFAAAANGLVQAGRLPMVTADYSAVTPWIAAAAGDASVAAQVFVTLGMSYQPLAAEPGEPGATQPAVAGPVAPEEPTEPVDAVPPRPVDDEPTRVGSGGAPRSGAGGVPQVPPQPVSGAPASGSAPVPPRPVSPPPVSVVPPRPVSPPPMSPPPMSSQPMSSQPTSVPPQPVSAPPTSVPPQPVAGMPSPTVPAASPHDPYAAGPADAGRSRRRTWLLVGAVLVALVVLGGGGGAIALTLRSDGGGTEPPPTASPSGGATATAPAEAAQPGIEPPVDGEWPADWPTFEEGEATPVADLAGVGFPFEVPEGWSCTPVTTTEDEAHYACGPGGNGDLVGGDLIVRACADPCDADRRVSMRRAEEAWGLQWVRDSGFRSWAETNEIDGQEGYGFVLVGYWRTAPEGRLDRQVVLRMSAPLEQVDDVRQLAGSVRAAIRDLTPG
jgi:hypothetical protein